ncbi:hypothetical protein H0H81_010219 [Sphagnurus paluster]|uniref:Uncharacterized protein n=1 Tax=Sphagnurus paluster TaxID=117069 RepID=A0A9P7FVB2_9AGAR|nr:hypothetical protein H0H81_010219 [Sphagnurus paluster]
MSYAFFLRHYRRVFFPGDTPVSDGTELARLFGVGRGILSIEHEVETYDQFMRLCAADQYLQGQRQYANIENQYELVPRYSLSPVYVPTAQLPFDGDSLQPSIFHNGHFHPDGLHSSEAFRKCDLSVEESTSESIRESSPAPSTSSSNTICSNASSSVKPSSTESSENDVSTRRSGRLRTKLTRAFPNTSHSSAKATLLNPKSSGSATSSFPVARGSVKCRWVNCGTQIQREGRTPIHERAFQEKLREHVKAHARAATGGVSGRAVLKNRRSSRRSGRWHTTFTSISSG